MNCKCNVCGWSGPRPWTCPMCGEQSFTDAPADAPKLSTPPPAKKAGGK